MDPEKAKLGIEGKGAPPYPRLLFICTRVLPIAFAAGAVHLALFNYLYPMSEEQRQELIERRSGKGTFRSRVPPRTKGKTSATTQPENPYADDTELLADEGAQPLDLSHLRVDQEDPSFVTDKKDSGDENIRDGSTPRGLR